MATFLPIHLLGLLLPLLALATLTPAAEPGKLAAALQPFVDKHELAGAVMLVADKDKVLAVEAVGYADIENKKPLKTDSTFWIASMSKPMTAVAVMMLVDEGKIQLDDPVDKYLPEFKDQWMIAEQDNEHILLKKPKQAPTIRQLLSHTSGLPFKSAIETPTLDRVSLRDAVRTHAMTPLQWEPGTKYQYSNAGINTAACVIEVVTGQPFEKFFDERLLHPLGMKDTTFWPSDEQVARLAEAYKPNSTKDGLERTTIAQLTYPLTLTSRQPMPGGGLFSTAADCAKFCQMLLNGGTFAGKRYLSENALKELTTKQTGDLKDNYGLGFSVGPTYGHGGALATNMSVDPKRGLITVWLVQHAGFPGEGGKARGVFQKAANEAYGR